MCKYESMWKCDECGNEGKPNNVQYGCKSVDNPVTSNPEGVALR
jgi:hypothetical protein